MLARTDLNSLGNGASHAAAQLAGMGYKTWLATLDDKTRVEHAEAHGQTVALNGTFTVGGEDADYPGDPALSDAMAANCFPAGTAVAGSVLGAFRAPYRGELVTVVTRRGRRLSGTPNHPVLTPAGWKPLAFLEKGDHLICASSKQRMMSGRPDVDDAPAMIEEVFDSLLVSGHRERIAGLDVDFHGDLPNGDVDVVRTDSLLELPLTPSGFQPGQHLSLPIADELPVLLAGERLGSERTGRVLAATPSGVSEPSKRRSLLGRHALHSDRICLGTRPALDSPLGQPAFDHLTRNAEAQRDLLLAQFVIDVEPDYLIDINRRSVAAHNHITATQVVSRSFARDTVLASNLGLGHPSQVVLDEVIAVKSSPFHGDVFTLDTEQGYYIANDFIVQNCRCTVAYGETLDEAQGLTAAGLPSSDEKGIMRGMATLKQRRRRYERRAARSRPAAQFGSQTLETQDLDGLVAAAIPPKSTPVVDRPWDGPANVAKIPNDAGASVLRGMYAFVIPGKDPATKAAYHLPHHEVVDGKPGPANIAGVRNAMGRAAQIKPPLSDADMAGVRAHLQRHIDDFNRQNKNSLDEGEVALGGKPSQGTRKDKRLKENQNAMTAAARAIPFSGTGAIEGQIADDNTLTPRVLLPGSLEWPEMPVSFMAQTVTAEGHDGAEVAGRVDEFARKKSTGKKNAIYMTGELTTPFGINEIAPMVEDETMRYVSADLGAAEWAIVGRDTLAEIPMDELNMDDLHSGAYALGLKSGKIKAMTLVATQALEGAMISLTASADAPGDATLVFPVELVLGTSAALVASPAPLNPPRSWFETQEPPGKMPLTVTRDGRVYGHLATWDSCHASFLPQCVPPPKSPSNYARFHTAYLDTEEGDEISVGKLMFSPGNGGHADRRLTAAKASAHYDKTGMAAAYLRASDGQYGIWVAGAINPDLTDEQREQMRRELRLNPPSGDWRVWDGQYDLLCGLAVAIPGFGVEAAAEVSIVASAHGVEMRDALIASSGWFDADDAAVAALEHEGLIDEELHAERQIRALAARAEGLDSLAALID